jgi:CubicO group peptidase (beta-lactamase class C family)
MTNVIHRRGYCALVPALVVSAAVPALAAAATGGALEGRVDAVMAGWAKPDSPGCAVGVLRDGTLAVAKGYGQADLERGVPIGPASVFDIASTSKKFTAAVIALLAQEGKLSLDDDVRRFLPELPRYEAPITIRHLLHHTSGLRDYTDVMALEGWQMEDWTTSEQALATIVRQKELNFRPGAQHLYSNTGFFLLSVIAERAGGKPFPDLARRLIFEPLGMTSTHFHADHRLLVKDRAIGYAPRDGGWALSMSDWEQTGDGSVLTTVEDLARWVRNFDDPKVGGKALIDELQRKGKLTSGEEIDYAEGLRHAPYRGLVTVGHSGSWAGYRSNLLRFPSEKTAVIVLCNAENAEAGALAREDRRRGPGRSSGPGRRAVARNAAGAGAERAGGHTGGAGRAARTLPIRRAPNRHRDHGRRGPLALPYPRPGLGTGADRGRQVHGRRPVAHDRRLHPRPGGKGRRPHAADLPLRLARAP